MRGAIWQGRPPVPEDMVVDHNQQVLVPASRNEGDAQRHARAHQLEGPLGQLLQQRGELCLASARWQSKALQLRRGARIVGREHGLQQLPVALHKVRAERLLAPRQQRQRGLQRGDQPGPLVLICLWRVTECAE